MTSNTSYRHWRNLRGEAQARIRELKRDMTPCERTVWDALRNRSVSGVKFRRQHPLDGFILDFYAPELRLAVEIDGDVHAEPKQKEYDRWRDAKLAAAGVTMIRVSNGDVAVGLPEVLDRIRIVIETLRQR